MGTRIIITEFHKDCTRGADDGEENEVHGIENPNGDEATLCGMPLCDEAKSSKITRRPISCRLCINVLRNRPKFKERNGLWY